ncbi:MAG: hypothetical protein ACE5PV_14275 [Candidatus Poribacteria bacterium]
MPSNPKPVLYKTIFQARYKPSLNFYDLLMPAAQRMTEYPHWQTSRLSVVLRDFDKHCSLVIGHNAFGYEQDSSDEAMEEQYIQHALAELPQALEIKDFIRLGFRRNYLVRVDMPFESLVTVLSVKLLSQNEQLRRIMPERVEDMIYRVDSSEEPYQFHFTIGPVRKQEIPRYLVYNQAHHLPPESAAGDYQAIVEEYPPVALFMDIDIYWLEEQLQLKDAALFVADARPKVHQIATELTNYLFELEV